ncbi:isocitrate lyase/PEP mutase family protein [Orrella marina]|uniref:2-methylisocitrate lyase n=1 Tax=Orrella marina TaxID=2163011 RepID=A0A2R4XGQ3_9BURK|nr:oxaloacetate decarboxylase [Orrella marina]AWB33002.1 carboxyvinyl-carboxyphosphonate phosphorylmutase [Orrella marina]
MSPSLTDPHAQTYPAGLTIKTGRNQALRAALASDQFLIAPGAFDCLSARLVEKAGFGAVYLTGSGMSMSALGAPDVGLMTFTEVLDRAKRIADLVGIPIVVDADTGYGGPLNVVRTVREFEKAGVSAIQLEDQAWPKKCGHEAGRQLVSTQEMVGRIKAAADGRLDPDLVIIARTDARSDHGLQAAIERGQQYAEAGADVIFVESPQSREELATVGQSFKVPLLANMVEGGRTPILPADELSRLGFSMAIYPNALTRLFAKAGLQMLAQLAQDGTTDACKAQMFNHRELWSLFEYEKWIQTEERLR